MNSKSLPTNKQIRGWLKSPEVTKWVKTKLSNHAALWEACRNALINDLCLDKTQECTFGDLYLGVAISVSPQTWVLSASIAYDDGIVLCPSCPYRLEDYLGKRSPFNQREREILLTQ